MKPWIDVAVVGHDQEQLARTLASIRRQGDGISVHMLDEARLPLLANTGTTSLVALVRSGDRLAGGTLARMARAIRGHVVIAGASTNVGRGRQVRPDAPPLSTSDAAIEHYASRLARYARSSTIELRTEDTWWVVRRDFLRAVATNGGDPVQQAIASGHRAVVVIAAYVHRSAREIRLEVPAERDTVPLISCIVPTHDRPAFLLQNVRNFLAQDHPAKELVVVDDGSTPASRLLPGDERIRIVRLGERLPIGEKRNIACAHARGQFVAHMDDDDWYPPDRLTKQLRALEATGASVTGSSEIILHDLQRGTTWRYHHPMARGIAGTTLFYRRSYWAAQPFLPLSEGEDLRFVQRAGATSLLLDQRDDSLCVAFMHGRNTTVKRPSAQAWRSIARDIVDHRLGAQLPAYRDAARGQTLLVSCIMPTYNRPAFAELALAAFDAQTYPLRELVIIDDGTRPVPQAVARAPGVRYVRLPRRASIGAKRNLAVQLAKGDVVCLWDDDDWYGAERLRRQTWPILVGDADITGIPSTHLVSLNDGVAWTASDALHRQMFEGNVAGGTIAFRRSAARDIRFPATNLAEDAAWLRSAVARGLRLKRLDNHGDFVYMRHGRNTWQFEPGSFLDPAGWQRCELPNGLTGQLLTRYREAAGSSAH